MQHVGIRNNDMAYVLYNLPNSRGRVAVVGKAFYINSHFVNYFV
ncbi:hypothetical protein PAENIP36_30820 [Paenibacillus sp. P36]